jgi:hypothetical protein
MLPSDTGNTVVKDAAGFDLDSTNILFLIWIIHLVRTSFTKGNGLSDVFIPLGAECYRL